MGLSTLDWGPSKYLHIIDLTEVTVPTRWRMNYTSLLAMFEKKISCISTAIVILSKYDILLSSFFILQQTWLFRLKPFSPIQD